MPKTIKRTLLPIVAALFAVCFALGLTACKKKDVSYTVEVYLETLTSSSDAPQYERGEDLQGTAEKGETITIEAPAVDGFTPIEHENNVATAKVGKENFRFYYSRNVYTVSYDKHEPAGLHTVGAVESSEHKYGETVTLPSADAFSTDGAVLAGYSLSEDGGEVLRAGATFTVEGETTVYAIWNRGLRNRMGGDDLLYVYREYDPAVGELIRAGQSFVGTVSGDIFTYETDDGTSHSCVVGATSFAYAVEARAGEYHLLQNVLDESHRGERTQIVSRVDSTVTLTTDEYLNATLDENGTKTEGELVYVGTATLETSESTAVPEYSFVEKKSGQEQFRLYFTEGEEGKAFVRRGGEYGYGVGLRLCFEIPFETMLDFSLDGYGNLRAFSNGYAFIFVGDYAVQSAYDVYGENGSYREYIVSATIFAENRFMTTDFRLTPAAYSDTLSQDTLSDGTPIFEMFETDKMYGTYRGNGFELKLDGFGIYPDSAILTNSITNKVMYRGTYSAAQSWTQIGLDWVITLTGPDGGNRMYRLGTGNNATVYTDGQLAGSELVHYEGDFNMIGDYVLSIWDQFSARLYQRDAHEQYQPISDGTIEFHNYGDYFSIYTFHPTGNTAPFSFSMSLIYNTDPESRLFARNDYYRIYSVLQQEGSDPNYEEWTETNGNGVIWYNEQSACTIYFPDGVNGSIAYDCSGGLTPGEDVFGDYYTLAWVDYGNGDSYGRQSEMLSVNEVDGEKKFSFVSRTSLYAEEGGQVKGGDPTLTLDGAGRAIYNPNGTGLDGTYTQTPDPVYGTRYHFQTGEGASEQTSFYFVLDEIFDSSTSVLEMRTVFRVLNSSLDQSFAGTNFTLELDGLYRGAYSAGGTTYRGEYYYVGLENPIVCFTAESGERFNFRVSGTAIDRLDNAYGSYTWNGANVTFDGNGNATGALSGQYVVQSESDGRIVIRLNSETYAVGGGTVRLYRSAFDGTFVCGDGGVLVSDGASSFVWHNAIGERVVGTLVSFNGEDQATVTFGETTYHIDLYGTEADIYI